MELMHVPWLDIMLMPYLFFIDTIKWKIDLEDEKRKKLEERTKGVKVKTRPNLPPLKQMPRTRNRTSPPSSRK